MIIQPKKEIIVPIRNVVGLKGRYRLQTINKFSGKITKDTGWFDNVILTSGKNIMADRSDWIDHCQVGTDNTTPDQAQTSLLGHHAGTSTVQSTVTGQTSSPPYYGWKRRTYRFSAGTVAANLSEVGVGWGTTGSTLISRGLVLDPISQVPTTITPLIDELLDLTYELRYYSPTIDVVGPQVTLAGTVYDTTTRAANVTSAQWSTHIGSAMGEYALNNSSWMAFDDVLGTVLTDPNGLTAACDNDDQWNSAYVNNSYEIEINTTCGITGWNLGSGIRSLRVRTTAGDYQTQFSSNPGGNSIPKDNTYTMIMAWMLGWAEKV